MFWRRLSRDNAATPDMNAAFIELGLGAQSEVTDSLRGRIGLLEWRVASRLGNDYRRLYDFEKVAL